VSDPPWCWRDGVQSDFAKASSDKFGFAKASPDKFGFGRGFVGQVRLRAEASSDVSETGKLSGLFHRFCAAARIFSDGRAFVGPVVLPPFLPSTDILRPSVVVGLGRVVPAWAHAPGGVR